MTGVWPRKAPPERPSTKAIANDERLAANGSSKKPYLYDECFGQCVTFPIDLTMGLDFMFFGLRFSLSLNLLSLVTNISIVY
jgi:hypothetical protein